LKAELKLLTYINSSESWLFVLFIGWLIAVMPENNSQL